MPNVKGGHQRLWNRQPVARDRIWQSMRVMRRFTQPDLQATAEAGRDNVRKYVRGLVAAGYLRIVKPKDSGRKGGHPIYQLVRDTGPRAPRLQSDGSTWDPNEHHVYHGGIAQR